MQITTKGRYRARATGNTDLGFSSGKGTPQLNIEFEILAEGYEGERITAKRWFTDATKEHVLKELRICGWKTDDVSDLTGIDENEVELVIDFEEYDGKPSLKVAFINRPGGVGLKAPMSDADKKAFAAKMRGDAVKSRSAALPAAANGSGKGGGAAPF